MNHSYDMREKDDESKVSVYICDKCGKWMANHDETISRHDNIFCVKRTNSVVKKTNKPRRKKS